MKTGDEVLQRLNISSKTDITQVPRGKGEKISGKRIK